MAWPSSPTIADVGQRERRLGRDRRRPASSGRRGGAGTSGTAVRYALEGGLVAPACGVVAEAQPALGLEADRDDLGLRPHRHGRATARRCASGRRRRAGKGRSCPARRGPADSRSGRRLAVRWRCHRSQDTEAAPADRSDDPPGRKRRNPGDDLCSRKAALSVSSALESLTSVFGMGTGVASPLESPGFRASGRLFGVAAAIPMEAATIELRSREGRFVRPMGAVLSDASH